MTFSRVKSSLLATKRRNIGIKSFGAFFLINLKSHIIGFDTQSK